VRDKALCEKSGAIAKFLSVPLHMPTHKVGNFIAKEVHAIINTLISGIKTPSGGYVDAGFDRFSCIRCKSLSASDGFWQSSPGCSNTSKSRGVKLFCVYTRHPRVYEEYRDMQLRPCSKGGSTKRTDQRGCVYAYSTAVVAAR
jgi:hypothetical protein